MKILVKLLKYLVVVIAALVVVGAGYQWQAAASDRAQYPAPGTLYAIDGLQMHLDCRGQGEPTVILESGLLSGSSSWRLVHDPLSEVTRICAYDRAGMDWSTPTDQPVDATNVTRSLHELLEVAGVEGPQIILGMSAGGVFVREYYRRYPEQIVGMVLVDSSHEQQGARLPEIGDSTQMSSILSLCSWFQPIGVIRAFRLIDPFLNQYELPEEALALARANAYQSHSCASLLLESEGFQREIYDAEPPGSLGDLPLTVLSQGKPPEANETFGMTLEDAEKMAIVWDELQNELTALSSVGHRLKAMQSGHVIQLEQPQIVIDEVTALVLQLRAFVPPTVQE
jgi:pimeloyl-ACP methyl ester carboxylesterase